MARYIDKDLFLQDIKMRYCNNCARPNEIKCRACHIDDMLGEIEDALTADVVELKHGYWIDKPNGRYLHIASWCSVCGNKSGIGGIESNRHKPYCPNCGAKMDGGKAE